MRGLAPWLGLSLPEMNSPPHNGSHIDTQSQEERAQLASLVDFDPGYIAHGQTITVAIRAESSTHRQQDRRVEWMSRAEALKAAGLSE